MKLLHVAAAVALCATVVVCLPLQSFRPSPSSFYNKAGRSTLTPKLSRNAGVYIDELVCRLDPKVNATTFANFTSEILSLWEPFCAANRGVFVTNPPDGETYNCGKIPSSWGISSVAEIVHQDADKGVDLLDKYISAVFNTTTVKDPDSCDFNSLGLLHCGEAREQPWKHTPWVKKLRTGESPLRAVNIGGLFVLEPWITPDFTNWDNDVPDQYMYSEKAVGNTSAINALVNHWNSWYTPADFADMAKAGLNSIRLPVGWWYWAAAAKISSYPYIVPTEDVFDMNHPIVKIIKMAADEQLMVILDLHGAPSSQNGLDNSGQRSMDVQIENWGDTWLYNATAKDETTEVLVQMTKWINFLNANGLDNVILLELVNEPWVFGDMSVVRDWYLSAIPKIRAENATLPLLIHDAFRHLEWSYLLHHWEFDNVYMDTHLYHAFNVADLASSTADCDKSKMVAHENMACRYSSMLRYKTCTSLPVFVGEFSLATDNCMPFLQGSVTKATQFADYGQCKNLQSRATDPFWKEHLKSFASRQIATFEKELGWAFWTYKVSDAASSAPDALYWSFKQALAEGLIDTTYPACACDHSIPQLDGC